MLEDYVSCPKCGWEPDQGCRWICDVCDTRWNTFDTHGQCPGCKKIFTETSCSRGRGGCGQVSIHDDWYHSKATIKKNVFTWFCKTEKEFAVAKSDRIWIESNLIWVINLFTPELVQGLPTISPYMQNFKRKFSGCEADADYLLKIVADIVGVDPSMVKIMYFSDESIRFTDGKIRFPGQLIDENGNTEEINQPVRQGVLKEVWLDIAHLNSVYDIVASLSVQLSKLLLAENYAIKEQINLRSNFASLVFGFGVFRASVRFELAKWNEMTGYGWQPKKTGGFSEPMLAYAIAWLSHYHNEEANWTKYFNQTTRGYFDQCYKYIDENKDKVRWP